MSLFDIIYDFFKTYLFSSDNGNMFLDDCVYSIGGQSFNGSEFLSTLFTFIVLALIFAFLVKLTIWIFKFFGGLFKF